MNRMVLSAAACLLALFGYVDASAQLAGSTSLSARMAKASPALTTTFTAPVPARRLLLEKPALLDVRGASLASALTELASKAKVPLLYSPSLLTDSPVFCACRGATVGEALDRLLANTDFRFVEEAGRILIEVDPAPAPAPAPTGPVTPSRKLRTPMQTARLRTPLPRVSEADPNQARIGTITGIVRDAGTLQPIAGAQVALPALQRGTLTRTDGRYLLVDVPDGTHTIEVSSIGYGRVSDDVTVASNAQVTLDFSLRSAAISLDEVVVTGAGVREERRRLGFASSAVGATEIESRPVQNVTDALRGQIPGVIPSGAQAGSGSASPIRIRGQRSLSQRNDPLVFIDGVRQDASMSNIGPMQTNRLDDINPQDIERIEVIKGAAAATLFGTEASSGVIQIFTKSGQQGPTRYSFSMQQGLSEFPRGNVPPVTFYDRETRDFLTLDPIGAMLRTGHLQDYNLSISGGTPLVEYFVSGRYMNEEDALRPGGRTNFSLRSRTNVNHRHNLRSEIGLNVIRNEVRLPNTRPQDGPMLPHVASHPRNVSERLPFGESFFTVAGMLSPGMNGLVDRYSADIATTYTWRPNITSRLVAGYSNLTDKSFHTVERGQSALNYSTGRRQIFTTDRRMLTLDFNTSAQTRLSDQVGLQLWGGGQMVSEKDEGTRLRVSDFPVPGLTTLSGGSRINLVQESFQQVINAGLFSQAQLDFGDRLFLTAGLRGDGNSAFGEDFGISLYPKVSGSYVLSDEAFWPTGGAWSLLRLRAAYGHSGLQPGAFDAVQTWQPRSRQGQAIVWADNLGNPDLRPERSVELEFGVDASLLNDRLGLELTYFTQTTQDALVPVPRPASTGFRAAQLQNVGETEASGIEALVNWNVIEGRNFSWSMTATGNTLSQTVNSLGGVDEYTIQVDRIRSVVAVGQAPGVFAIQSLDHSNPYRLDVPVDQLTSLSQIHANRLKNAAGQDSILYSKGPLPSVSGTFSTEVGLPAGLQLRALFTGGLGFQSFAAADLVWYQNLTHPVSSGYEAELHDPNTSTARREEIALIHARKHPSIFGNWVLDGDYIKFQELALGYNVPQSISGRFSLSNLSLNLTAQNLALWTKEWEGVVEPTLFESRRNGGRTVDVTNQRFHSPASRRLTLGVRAAW